MAKHSESFSIPDAPARAVLLIKKAADGWQTLVARENFVVITEKGARAAIIGTRAWVEFTIEGREEGSIITVVAGNTFAGSPHRLRSLVTELRSRIEVASAGL